MPIFAWRASAPSMAAKACPQQAWFLNVMRVMWKSRPSVASASCQSGPCHRAPETGLAFDDIERAGDAFARGQRRGHAGLGGTPGVQRLGHRVHAEGLLHARAERGH